MDKREIIKDDVEGLIKDRGLTVSDDKQYSSLHKAVLSKTERLVTAVHLVTGLIDTREKIRWGLRSASIDSIADLYLLSRTLPGARSLISDKIMEKISYVVSLLEVGYTGGLISKMNYSIIREEYLKLKDALVKFRLMDGAGSFVLPENFFGNDISLPEKPFLEPIKDTDVMSVMQKDETLKKTTLHSVGMGQEKNKRTNSVSTSGSARRDIILKAIKDRREYTIKDIILEMSNIDPNVDCSDKTVQRDLLSLVAGGILLKRGERRWSRYSRVAGSTSLLH